MKIINLEQWRKNEPSPYSHMNFPIILYWSPKAGCTTLLKWFLYQADLLDVALEYHPWVHQYEVFIKSKPEYIDELLSSLPYKDSYKLVRNPYTRAVSGFLMLFTYMDTILQSVKEHLYNDPHSPKGLSFKQFLYYLKDLGVGHGHIEFHFAMQYREGEEHYIDQYIYLENLSDELAKLERKYSLKKSNLSDLSNSHHHFSSLMTHRGNFANVSFTDPAFPKLPTYSSFYDYEAIQLVRELYKKDFEKYGYSKNIKHL
ncbi:sulfotransferase family 2 domain-containing protein [Paenibacillus sp. Soil787]|uniref:sulfotransferase family 2 domain-containing protein n=1 Tax=Paenibacillus sp. Soil787 TaxID=1736411 RepID=UPI00070362C5|nr:sulfotransferase family 2 domain-containing protein [Paenibacillus sp. Soil787]KRF18676.1 hypothetical protein ASG93_11640 [Paenibacillus sp. Soil787]